MPLPIYYHAGELMRCLDPMLHKNKREQRVEAVSSSCLLCLYVSRAKRSRVTSDTPVIVYERSVGIGKKEKVEDVHVFYDRLSSDGRR